MGLAAVFAGSFMIAQAGTTRSAGGHSMVNARNFSATRNLGGRSGGHFAGYSRTNLDSFQKAMTELRNRIGTTSYQKGHLANYIRAHGGVVTTSADKYNRNFSAQVLTGRGGEFSVNTHRVNSWTITANEGTAFAGAGNMYDHTATIKTANGNTYSGNGASGISMASSVGSADGIPTASFGRSHSGQATIKGHHLPTSGSTSLTVNKEGQVDVVHEREVGEYFSDMGEHAAKVTISKSDNGVVIDRIEEGNLTGVNGNNVQSSTETTVTKTMDSEIKVEHPNAESQYILYNGQPIGKV